MFLGADRANDSWNQLQGDKPPRRPLPALYAKLFGVCATIASNYLWRHPLLASVFFALLSILSLLSIYCYFFML